MRRLAILLVVIVAAGDRVLDAHDRALGPASRQPGDPPDRLQGDVLLGDNSYWEQAQLWIGSQSTRATGCSISLWTRRYGGAVGWNGPS